LQDYCVDLKHARLQIRRQIECLLGQLHHFFGAAPVLGDAFRAVPVVVDDREATAIFISSAPLQLNSGLKNIIKTQILPP